MEFLTTKQAAERLGITSRRVQALVTAGRLPAQKFGRDYMIREKDLKLVENRKVGRPKKTSDKK
ncbi:MAG TPA: helix-turn-helix domain-containing protein [Pyrinomonadaceae bacterium]|jgi:excisionase family DNA binding protein